jgi:RNA polymerase sigma-70 factor (ECF subfamily)
MLPFAQTVMRQHGAMDFQTRPTEGSMERTSSAREQEANAVQTEARLRWLLLRGLSGDKVCYREFLAATAMHLRAFFGRCLIHRSSEVEGLVQKALSSIHNRRGSYSAHIPATAWIFAIAQHELGIYMHGPPRACTMDLAESQSLSPAMKSLDTVSQRDLEKIFRLLEKSPEMPRHCP